MGTVNNNKQLWTLKGSTNGQRIPYCPETEEAPGFYLLVVSASSNDFIRLRFENLGHSLDHSIPRIITRWRTPGAPIPAHPGMDKLLRLFYPRGNLVFLRASRIAMVVLDLMMPGVGGKRCLEELLRIDHDVRVVMASGYSSPGVGQEVTQAGARGFISKPYDSKEILGAIRKVLDEDH
jgi:CheY-like chemotaxis protein